MVDTDAVFFDVGGTLLEVSPSVGHVYADACRARGAVADPDAIQAAFDEAWVTLSRDVPRGADRYSHYPGGERAWWDRVSTHAFDRCGVGPAQRPPVEELRAVFAKPGAWNVFPEARACLASLRRRGLRLGVISNWDSRLPALLRALDLHGHFEEIIYSAAAGCEKPHPDIFQQALARLGVEADRSWHIGDRIEDDYTGAREAGMRALLLNRAPGRNDLKEEVERWGRGHDLVADLNEATARILDGA